MQASASLLGRCFAMAEIEPAPAAMILTPAVLYDIGYALMDAGECGIHAIDVVDGKAMLTRASSWDIMKLRQIRLALQAYDLRADRHPKTIRRFSRRRISSAYQHVR